MVRLENVVNDFLVQYGQRRQIFGAGDNGGRPTYALISLAAGMVCRGLCCRDTEDGRQ